MRAKKKARKTGKPVPKSKAPKLPPRADVEAFNTFVLAQVMAARKEGLELGLGIDAAESLRLLAVESARLREGLGLVRDRLAPIEETDSASSISNVLSTVRDILDQALLEPPQRFSAKEAAMPTDADEAAPLPTGSAPESAPPTPVGAPPEALPPAAPPADESPASVPL